MENLFSQTKKLDVVKGGKSKTTKQKLLSSINSEIEIIKDRKDTELQTLGNGSKEIRFFTPHTNPNKVNLKLRVRKKIFRQNNDNTIGWEVDNSIKSIVEFLKTLYSQIEKFDESDDMFKYEMCGIE